MCVQAMGSLCHEIAKLQADRAQLEDLLAQVLHPLLLVNLLALGLSAQHAYHPCMCWASLDLCSTISMLARKMQFLAGVAGGS